MSRNKYKRQNKVIGSKESGWEGKSYKKSLENIILKSLLNIIQTQIVVKMPNEA